jgi:hypothetical protein
MMNRSFYLGIMLAIASHNSEHKELSEHDQHE